MHKRFSAFKFSDIDTLGFSPERYSHLKFGCDQSAAFFGQTLAERFFEAHSDVLLANRCVVIPSPYNYVPNAATILAKHFTNHLNRLLVSANGDHVEFSIIHRKVSYTNDYGFLPKEKRRSLINNDKFYLNRRFLKGKVLIFIDDIRITGTHEDKLIEILAAERMSNDSFFLYIADHDGSCPPDIEAQLNFAGVKTLSQYRDLALAPHHHVIVRPIKFLLKQDPADLTDFIEEMIEKRPSLVDEVYFGCLGEGYYKIPDYQESFTTISLAHRC